MKKLYIIFIIFFLFANLNANIGEEGFRNYPNKYFVETGTHQGNGLEKAIKTGHFKKLYSIDINPLFIKTCQKKFKAKKNIYFYVGDSSAELWKVISNLEKPITFWLDAHNGFPDPNSNDKNTAILEELEQIKRHPIKTHTILIDDLHCCGTLLFDFVTLSQIIEKVKEINPEYKIDFIPGGDMGEYPLNILVATPPEK